MSKQLYVYDTTLRDGAQYRGISFSLQDKLKITQLLDNFGVDYIEGGWPGSNPKDEAYFKHAKNLVLKHAKLVAFGSTRKPMLEVDNDPQIQSLLSANTPAVALVSKFWTFHIETVLRTDLTQNLSMIYDSVAFFKAHGREVVLDAEHFFDGFKDNQDYTFQCIEAAVRAGVDNLTLCDTNGGSMPQDIEYAVKAVRNKFPTLSLGIHCHNDCELAVANSLSAVKSGVSLLQGTINGYGERCGNANLISLLANLLLKQSFNQEFGLNSDITSERLSDLSKEIADIANIPLKADAAYVGDNAFSHKGGIHVAAIAKASQTYEHLNPSLVGNQREITISELSGKSNVQLQAQKLGLDVSRNFQQVLDSIKALEKKGLTLENAPGSFEMLVRKQDKSYQPHFTVLSMQVGVNDMNASTQPNADTCTATVKVRVKNKIAHVVEEASGPVDALNLAFKKALTSFFPQVQAMQLTDYKVSILDPEKASAATTRVWIQSCCKDSTAHDQCWATIGCSDNIIKASAQALIDSYQLFLIKHNHLSQNSTHQSAQHRFSDLDNEVTHNGHN